VKINPNPLKIRALAGLFAGLGLLTLTLLVRGPRADARPITDEPASETFPLFNGKNLDGWEGEMKYWSVEDGVIVGKNSDKIAVSTYLVTKKKYTDFRLTAKVKLVKSEMHSGIAFWGRVAPDKGAPFTYLGHLVMFPEGWGMYDLHRRNGLPVDGKPAKAASKGDHEWNDLEILATGLNVKVAVNGVAVVDFTDKSPEFKAEAPIGLQLHSNAVPQEVHFKDLIIETFPKELTLKTVKKP
jgi:Domain of Unknown Function (DUF1080)